MWLPSSHTCECTSKEEWGKRGPSGLSFPVLGRSCFALVTCVLRWWCFHHNRCSWIQYRHLFVWLGFKIKPGCWRVTYYWCYHGPPLSLTLLCRVLPKPAYVSYGHMPPLRCCGGEVPFLQVVLPVPANRVGSNMWLCHCASGLASCLCAASRTLHYCSLNDGCYQAVLPAMRRFSGYGWVSSLEGLSQQQEVSQFALVYCVLCKSTEAAGLRAAMSD